MKIFELLLGVLALIGSVSIFSIRFSGSLLMTITCWTLLSCLYFYLGVALFNNIGFRRMFKKDSYKNISSNRIAGAAGAGVTISILIIGIMFKVMNWPGSMIMLFGGLVAILPIIVFSLIKLLNKDTKKDGFYKGILYRTTIYLIISLIMISIPYKTWLEWRYPDNPEFVEISIKYHENPENKEIEKEYIEARKKIFKSN